MSTNATYTVAQVTPYPWDIPHPINAYIEGLARQLIERGHRVLVVAPAASSSAVSESRSRISAAVADEDPSRLFESEDGLSVVLVGESVSLNPFGKRGLSTDFSRSVEQLFDLLELDFVHLHDPFAPSVSSYALRYSRALNIGTFHQPTERTLTTQLARRLVELIFGRLDARTASFQTTADLLNRFFPANYRVILPVTAGVEAGNGNKDGLTERPLEIFFQISEERADLRLLLRALRELPLELNWRATIYCPEGLAPPLKSISRALSERVEFVGADRASRAKLLSAADCAVIASSNSAADIEVMLLALAYGVVPVAASTAIYQELLDGGGGLLFSAQESETLTAQLARLGANSELKGQLQDTLASFSQSLKPERLAEEFEQVYAEVIARRHQPKVDEQIAARLSKRPLIDVDLHMHTDHSYDCATPVEVLLAAAKRQGLGAIAVTDHNEVSGALEAAAKAEGIKVIVGEEVKTADQGEVIGLFIKEKIPKGLTLQETVAEIKRQGGVVYVPHPFDRLHSVPDYEHLLAIIDSIDAIEIFNPRVAISSFNDEAARFAAKYRITAGAGSDSHVAQGLGSVRIRMRDFDGPEEFLASLREADIVHKPTSLFYVQALKFLQTKATPSAARDSVRNRRLKRALKE